ncbi:MAG: SLC13 family permease, partial [Longimicrobiales bacterium]|nr:SLC13 family permease [Longimicrobiales bacterium]
ALLVETTRSRLPQMQESGAFVIVSEVPGVKFRPSKAVPAVAVLATVVATAALGIVPIVVSATAGAVAMVILGCLTPEEAHRAIDWRVIFLLAGVLSLGLAMERTGGARLLSEGLIAAAGGLGPVVLIAVVYGVTTLLTEAMSNNAAAVLIAPIAIASAEALGVDPRPFLVAVTFAASSSFLTPVGYQTNTMIYGPGGYRFGDYFRVGAPLNLAFWILASVLIPMFWPL